MTTEQFNPSPDALLIEVGSDGDLYGRTRLVLTPDEGVLETFRSGTHELLQFDPGVGVTDIFDAVVLYTERVNGTPLGAARLRLPDEPRYHLALQLGGAVRFDGELSRSETEADPVLARVLAGARALAHEHSAGRALL